jgi:hypothetical protein
MLGFIPVDYCDPEDLACINLLCAGHQEVEVLVDKAKHELASGGSDQLASLRRKLSMSEEECEELRVNLAEMLSGVTITDDQLQVWSLIVEPVPSRCSFAPFDGEPNNYWQQCIRFTDIPLGIGDLASLK